MRAVGLTLLALNGGLSVSRAAVIQSTVELSPATGAYTLGSFCEPTLARCTWNATVSGFDVITRTLQNGNELVGVTANYSADIFTDNGGIPGTFLGRLIMPGTALFTFIGRDPAINPLGIFTTNLSDFAFSGMLNGNTFEVRQDPGRTSTGLTTILPTSVLSPITYTVSGFLEIAALYSFNGASFVVAPPRVSDVSEIPEPAFGVIAGLILVSFMAIVSRR